MSFLSSETNSQRARLLAYLKQYGKVNTIEARSILGVMSPAPRIREIIARGHTITADYITVATPLSVHVRVAEYHYHDEPLAQ
jgi:hypothetical protein